MLFYGLFGHFLCCSSPEKGPMHVVQPRQAVTLREKSYPGLGLVERRRRQTYASIFLGFFFFGLIKIFFCFTSHINPLRTLSFLFSETSETLNFVAILNPHPRAHGFLQTHLLQLSQTSSFPTTTFLCLPSLPLLFLSRRSRRRTAPSQAPAPYRASSLCA